MAWDFTKPVSNKQQSNTVSWDFAADPTEQYRTYKEKIEADKKKRVEEQKERERKDKEAMERVNKFLAEKQAKTPQPIQTPLSPYGEYNDPRTTQQPTSTPQPLSPSATVPAQATSRTRIPLSLAAEAKSNPEAKKMLEQLKVVNDAQRTTQYVTDLAQGKIAWYNKPTAEEKKKYPESYLRVVDFFDWLVHGSRGSELLFRGSEAGASVLTGQPRESAPAQTFGEGAVDVAGSILAMGTKLPGLGVSQFEAVKPLADMARTGAGALTGNVFPWASAAASGATRLGQLEVMNQIKSDQSLTPEERGKRIVGAMLIGGVFEAGAEAIAPYVSKAIQKVVSPAQRITLRKQGYQQIEEVIPGGNTPAYRQFAESMTGDKNINTGIWVKNGTGGQEVVFETTNSANALARAALKNWAKQFPSMADPRFMLGEGAQQAASAIPQIAAPPTTPLIPAVATPAAQIVANSLPKDWAAQGWRMLREKGQDIAVNPDGEMFAVGDGDTLKPYTTEAKPTPKPKTTPKPTVKFLPLEVGQQVTIKGREGIFTVTNASDRSLVELKNERGTTLKAGRATLTPVEAQPAPQPITPPTPQTTPQDAVRASEGVSAPQGPAINATDTAKEIESAEKMRGWSGRQLTNYPDEPTILAKRGLSEAILAKHGKGNIDHAKREIRAARSSWIENYGGKEINPQMEKAIVDAENTIREIEAGLKRVSIPKAEVKPTPKPKYTEKDIQDTVKYLKSVDKEVAGEYQSITEQVKEMGGIAPYRDGVMKNEYHRNVPIHVRSKAGQPADQIASELGMTEAELFQKLAAEKGGKVGRKDYRQEAIKMLDEYEQEGLPEAVQAFAGKAPKLDNQTPDSTISQTNRRDIIKNLQEKLDVPIRIGRFNQRALGIFKVKPEVVRTRVANDLPVIAHEVGHFLDKKLSLGNIATPELMTLGKKTSRPSYTDEQIRKEGVAEFMRLYLTSPAQAQKSAPQYYAKFEQTMIANPDIHDVLRQAQRDLDNWMKQPAKARILGSISVGEKPTRKMSFDRLYTAAVDELRPIQKYVKAVAGENVDVDSNPFAKAWLGRGWVGKAETFLKNGVVNENFKKIGPSFEEVLKPVSSNLDDFRAYIVAKRAVDLHARGVEPGISLDDARVTIKDLETGEFKTALENLVKYQDSLIKMLVDSGVFNNDTAQLMRKMNKNYVPFYRVFEELSTVGFGTGKGYANIQSPVKRMKGSTRDIIDPLESIIKNTFLWVNLAERNAVGKAIVELAEMRDGAGKWVEKVATPMRATKFELSEIEDALEVAGIDTDGLNLNETATIFKPSPFPAGKENILTVFRDGQKEYYQLDPELYRATLALDKESSNMFVNIMSMPARVLRAGATLTPEFMMRNPIRDVQQAMIASKYGFNPVDFMRGLFHAFKKDEMFWQFQSSGAAHGAMVSLDRDYLQGSLNNLLKQSVKDKSMNIIKNPLELLRALSEFGELATRLGEFGKGVKTKGQTRKGIMEAALAARDVTLDFARVGTAGKIPNKMIAFFNANVQGIDKTYRMFKENPTRSIMRSILYITLPTIALYMVNRDDDRYQELPQWQKDAFWIIPTKKRLYRIPRAHTLGVIFGALPERIISYLDKQDPKAFDGIAAELFGQSVPSFVPTALLGWIESTANKSLYSGMPIESMSDQRIDPADRYNAYTSETAKLIGDALNVSPKKADHVIRSYGGGLAQYGVKALDKIIDLATKEEKPAKPAGVGSDIPVFGAFIPRVWSSSESIDRFYDELATLETERSTLRRKKPDAELSAVKEKRLKTLRGIADELSDLRKEAQNIMANKNMSAETKRERLDALNIIQVNMARYAIGRKPIRAEFK